jgi:hypothetical protein
MKLSLLILCCLISSFLSAQSANVHFHIDKITIKEKIVLDSSNTERYQKKAVDQFRLNGYTGVSLKDSSVKNNTTHYYYSFKHKFDKIVLINPAKKRNQTKKNKDFISVLHSLNKELTSLENTGYPFAQIKITKQTTSGEELNLEYNTDSGNYFIINKINIKSQHKFHEKTVLNIIDLNVGEAYNEEKISAIGELLEASKLYQLAQPIQVLFREGEAELFIYINKEKSSNADGYIGFQQDQITNKLILNGFINLQLNNSLNRAEIIDFNWKSNPDKTQNLYGMLEYPFVFNSPFGIGGKINLRKQDTTFIRTDITLKATYYHPNIRFSIFDQLESSSTLNGSPPPNFRDYRKNTIGATARFIPTLSNSLRFYHPEIFILGGIYNYREDTLDDNKQKITNNKYQVEYRHTIDFLKYFHLNNTLSFQGLASSLTIARNELIYYGGLQSVRGFYELELSGNDIWTLLNEIEFRPVDIISIIMLYDYSTFNFQGHHYTNSFGFGFGLNNKGSKLQIIVANGILDNASLDLSNTKIHIGFTSNF